METYILRRLFQMILLMLIVSAVIFLMVRLLPGDPILMYLTRQDAEGISPETIAKMRHELGLDRPIYIQYAYWLSHVVRGDLGISLTMRRPVMGDMKRRLPITLQLGFTAFMISVIIGIPFGIIAAIRRGGWIDQIITTLGNLGICIPIFWLGILLIYLFGLRLGWLPIYGYTSPFNNFWLNVKQIIMPVFCLAIPPITSILRLTRSSMLEVMRQDYIRTAWAKGLKEWVVIARHALKNALIPVITLNGIMIVTILGGSVIIETVFNIPGMGRLAVEGLRSQDYPVIQGVVLFISIVATTVNLVVDLAWGWLDPRIRYD